MTQRAAVIGWPVEHSRSPLIHGHWIAEHGLDATYEAVSVAPDDLAGFMARLRTGALTGVNVTVPHKEAALALADAPDEAARRVGGANTLWVEDGRLHATTTDGPGFLAGLEEGAPGHGIEHALVLGAGGAARAIVAALTARGARVSIANRTQGRAEALARDFGAGAVAWDELGALARDADLLVNTTSLGMRGQPPLALPRGTVAVLPEHAAVADIVYAPLVTPLLAEGRARGLVAVDGLGMLLHQAAFSFEIWFGIRPAVTPELRRIVETDLVRARDA